MMRGSGMTEVESIAAVWRDRARVAEDAANELCELADAAGYLLGTNYFGSGCVEGDVLFGKLGEVLRSWRREAVESSTALNSVALNCRAAADCFALEDEAAGNGIR